MEWPVSAGDAEWGGVCGPGPCFASVQMRLENIGIPTLSASGPEQQPPVITLPSGSLCSQSVEGGGALLRSPSIHPTSSLL